MVILRLTFSLVVLLVALGLSAVAQSQVLKGTIRQESVTRQRIHRNDLDNSSINSPAEQEAPKRAHRRIHREASPAPPNLTEAKGVDLGAFEDPPTQDSHQENLLATFEGSYKGPDFDIGADRNSKELVLAWEKWHKQLCKTIYMRTRRRLSFSQAIGTATASITIARNNEVTVSLESSAGDPQISRAYLSAINSLNNNPGLTFPEKSKREFVSFRYSFIRATNITPGYDWIKNDFETVKTEW